MLSESQQDFLQHMRELGLAYQRKRSAPRFYVTRLALSLALGSSVAINSFRNLLDADPDALFSVNRMPTGVTGYKCFTNGSGNTPEAGYILVETNFRLYAYTGRPCGRFISAGVAFITRYIYTYIRKLFDTIN